MKKRACTIRSQAIRTSAGATLIAGVCFACSQTPAPEAPAQPEPEAAVSEPSPGPLVIKDVGLATPESVLHDTSTDTYLVSNINGAAAGKDDNGFISRIAPDGQVVALKWIDGAASDVELNAPKGLGIANGKLYVSDIDVIRTFDLATGKPAAQIPVPGATFLNDVAVGPDGTVYVSDTGLTEDEQENLSLNKQDAIYQVSPDGKLSTLIKGEQLGLPNGLVADATGLWVVTWSGSLYHVTFDGTATAPIQAPGAELDGIVQTADGRVLISCWEKSAVFVGTPATEFSTLVDNVKAPADIGYDSQREQLLVPLFTENTVEIVKVQPPAAAAAAPTAGVKSH